MRIPMIGVLTLTSLLAAGAAFAADNGPTAPGSATSAAATSSGSAMPSAAPSGTEKSDVVKMNGQTGIVKSFDAKTHQLTLADGSTFMLDQSLKGKDLKADQKVSFTFTDDGVKKTITHYQIMS